MANRRYLFFARQAEKEDIPEVAELFRETAEPRQATPSATPSTWLVWRPATDEPMAPPRRTSRQRSSGDIRVHCDVPGFASTARGRALRKWRTVLNLARAERTHAGDTRSIDKVRG